MGDQVDLQQQTRVLLLNGQTIILQGDIGEGTISELNSEILEQALQEAENHNDGNDNHHAVVEVNQDSLQSSVTPSSAVGSELHQTDQNDVNLDASDENNFVAIFENENGETQSVHLTLEQAAALGFQVPSDNEITEKEDINSAHNSDIKNSNQFSEVIAQNDAQNDAVNQLQIPAVSAAQSMQLQRDDAQPENSSILGNLLKPSTSSMLSLVPQYTVNPSSLTYSVKLQEPAEVHSSNTTNLSDVLLPTTNPIPHTEITTHHSFIPQTMSMPQSTGSSLLNQQRITIPVSSKSINQQNVARSLVKLKPPIMTAVSSATIRPIPTKTVIPKILGTPTSMANLSLGSALPISSTASMVRVLNNSNTVSNLPSVKPVINTPITTTSGKTTDASSASKTAANASKPLGSSENPIQLVQHGKTYHSMQPLSQDQLKQIATVLQQKQLDTSRNSKNVLFDASTNTRIIYRVVYPEDLALKKPTPGTIGTSAASLRGTGRGTGRKGRPPKSFSSSFKPMITKKIISDDEEEALDNDLSKGEKEERKKVLPRTRSGRLSRPPRHMVKDYKRIHHLDFAEPDLDDSDGGYSDYRISDSEAVSESALEDMPLPGENMSQVPGRNVSHLPNEKLSHLPEDNTTQPTADAKVPGAIRRAIHSKFRCPTCQKMYLGNRRLTKHFEMYPDHGSMDNVSKASPSGSTPTANLIRLQGEGEIVNGSVRPGLGGGRGRGRRRGNFSYLSPNERTERRKAKLREFLSSYDLTEVAEVAGPLVAQSLDVWQLLLMRVAACEDQTSRVGALLAELRPLLNKARAMANDVMMLNSHSMEHIRDCHQVEVNDEVVASALNISCGVYNVSGPDDRTLRWSPVSTQRSVVENISTNQQSQLPHPQQRDEQLDMPDLPASTETEEPETKKQRMWHEDNSKDDENTADKNFLDSTIESEKPSDTSMGSDTPLDDIVKAELKNLANKSGLEDFVAPPAPATSKDLSHSSMVDFVTSSFPISDQGGSHFAMVMTMPSTTVAASVVQMQPSEASTTTSVSSETGKIADNTMHFQLSSSERLDLSGGSIDVNLDTHLDEATHTLDFETFSEDFHTNTQN